MKKLRDILIVVVLGSVVLWWVVHFIGDVHEASVSASPVVAEASFACIDDGMLCHVGRDTFASEADAQAYLNGPEHQAKLKEREVKAEEERKNKELEQQAAVMAKRGVSVVRSACLRDGTFNCSLIDKDTAESFALMILHHRRDQLVASKSAQQPLVTR